MKLSRIKMFELQSGNFFLLATLFHEALSGLTEMPHRTFTDSCYNGETILFIFQLGSSICNVFCTLVSVMADPTQGECNHRGMPREL